MKRRWNLPLRMKPTSPTWTGLSGSLGLGSHKACPYEGYLMASCSRKISQSSIEDRNSQGEQLNAPGGWRHLAVAVLTKDQSHDSKHGTRPLPPPLASASFEPTLPGENLLATPFGPQVTIVTRYGNNSGVPVVSSQTSRILPCSGSYLSNLTQAGSC